MSVTKVRATWFSPTGTGKAVVESIISGIGLTVADPLDLTFPADYKEISPLGPDELLVVGMPVYAGRILPLAAERLQGIRGTGTLAVAVVVYGNREYEDALLELSHILEKCGCITIAAAAFIGEHSFSSTVLPIAPGRPNDEDLRIAALFGAAVRDKLASAATPSDLKTPAIPGEYPYRKEAKKGGIDFIAVGEECIQCGVCAHVCPTTAIDAADSRRINIEACISCCACIKRCPRDARSIKPGPILEVAQRLHAQCSLPKTVETFL